MAYNITLIPGDGIGPEVTDAMRHCLDALGVDIHWECKDAGQTALDKHGKVLPDDTIDSIRRNKVAIKGPITTPVGKGFRSVNVAIRHLFDLYACVRPLRSFAVPTVQHSNIDIVIVRENTEDLYAGIEFASMSDEAREIIDTIQRLSEKKIRPSSAISIKPISPFGAERIVQFAINWARANNRKKITCVHKANIMKCTDGLFLESFRKKAQDNPDGIEYNDAIVDNCAMQLVMRPQNFDILVLPNLYGDILSDLGAGLIGGLGLAAGANIGDEIAVFEPTHGSAPKYTGQNKVNPIATILSSALMLTYLGETEKAKLLERAVRDIVEEGACVTYDLKLNRNDPAAAGTRETAEAISRRIKEIS